MSGSPDCFVVQSKEKQWTKTTSLCCRVLNETVKHWLLHRTIRPVILKFIFRSCVLVLLSTRTAFLPSCTTEIMLVQISVLILRLINANFVRRRRKRRAIVRVPYLVIHFLSTSPKFRRCAFLPLALPGFPSAVVVNCSMNCEAFRLIFPVNVEVFSLQS